MSGDMGIYDRNEIGKHLALIFDCDGVLIDSSEVQKCAFYGSYKEVVGDDRCPPFSEYMKHTGDSLPNIFRKMGLPVEMAEPYRRISRSVIDKIIINEEAIELIRELKRQGVKSAICTGKDRFRMIEILKYFQIDGLFDAIVCSDDVAEPKPSGVPILKAIEDLAEEPGTRNIVIGDGYYDILSAKRAGCESVLTLWYGDEGVPREADYTVKTVKELRKLLDRILNSLC